MKTATRNVLIVAALFVVWQAMRSNPPTNDEPESGEPTPRSLTDAAGGQAAVLTASASTTARAAPVNAPTPPPGLCEQPPLDKLQQALVSIEYYAERGLPDPATRIPWLLSLGETLDTVACDRTFGRDRRRFRAREVAEKLDRAKPGLLDSLPLSSGAKFLAMDASLTDKAFQACCADILSARLWPPTSDSPFSVAVSFMMDVHLPYGEAANGLDPQSWDDAEESGFKSIAYLGASCPQTADAPEMTPAPQLGKGWSGAVLEDFEYGCSGGFPFCTAFRNHLLFESVLDATKKSFALDYELCPSGSLGGEMPGTGEVGPGALQVDCGFTSAADHPSRGPGWTRVKGAKRLTFSSALCGTNGCQDDSVSFAQRVLVEATAIALCARPGAVQEKCTTPNWDDQTTHPDRGEPERNAMCN